jgi:dihydroorotate dehydrogenase
VKALDGKIPVIAAGGISSPDDALKKIQAGASLIQIYTGFIYSGPELINDCAKALKNAIK